MGRTGVNAVHGRAGRELTVEESSADVCTDQWVFDAAMNACYTRKAFLCFGGERDGIFHHYGCVQKKGLKEPVVVTMETESYVVCYKPAGYLSQRPLGLDADLGFIECYNDRIGCKRVSSDIRLARETSYVEWQLP